jgi:hypothetical protein
MLSSQYIMERKVILIDFPNVTSVLVSLSKVYPGEAQCCLMRLEVTVERPVFFGVLSLKKSTLKILLHRGK